MYLLIASFTNTSGVLYICGGDSIIILVPSHREIVGRKKSQITVNIGL